MAYFVRRSYAETRRARAAALDEDIVALAAEMLASETRVRSPSGPFRLKAAIPAGGRGTTTLSVTPEDGGAMDMRLAAGALRGDGGVIPAACVTLEPSVLSAPRGGGAVVRVTVTPPPDAVPGVYRGALSAADGADFVIAIEAEVAC